MSSEGVNLGEAVEEQHAEISRRIQELSDQGKSGATLRDIRMLLGELRNVVEVHFEAEESLMEIHDYERRETHEAAHRGFLERLTMLQEETDRPEHEYIASLVAMLHRWFQRHEETEDKRLFESLAFAGE